MREFETFNLEGIFDFRNVSNFSKCGFLVLLVFEILESFGSQITLGILERPIFEILNIPGKLDSRNFFFSKFHEFFRTDKRVGTQFHRKTDSGENDEVSCFSFLCFLWFSVTIT